MKGIVFAGERKIELREFPDPTPGPNEVVLEIKASGMCGSDLKVYRAPFGEGLKNLGYSEGIHVIAGHEPCGVVVAVGATAADKAGVATAQFKEALADLNRDLRAAIASSKAETLQQVAGQMEKLAKQTNAALDSIAKGAGKGGGGVFTEDYPKEGVSYTVQKGDTLATIAKKTGARQQDIINANRLADPSRITVGQTLFIPAGK